MTHCESADRNKRKLNFAKIGLFWGIFIFISLMAGIIWHSNQHTEYHYSLNELDEGVYAIYYTTHSNIPSHNYEVVTLCCEENIYTFTGNVSISFTDEESPYVIIKEYNMVNNDEIYVHIPSWTLRYAESIDVGH